VPESDLPVRLPKNVRFEPTGQSPLTQIEEWVTVPCPIDGKPARRETDTLDTFMCSSWYQMRYIDSKNPERPFSSAAAAKWLPVDQYTGGAEHAVMHLLYTRFFWKAARDLGLVEGDEPMRRLFNQGVILGPDGNRMSKSRGNVVAPDEQVDQWGADAFRCQLMFVGPWDQGGPYNPTGMAGIVRWLNRLWSLCVESPTLVDAPADAAAAAQPTRPSRRLRRRSRTSASTP
jgi:leucyl-tRNA synthetase